MKNELLEKLEELLGAENPLEVQKEFNAVSAQLKSFFAATQEKEKSATTEVKKPVEANANSKSEAETPAENSATDGPIPSPAKEDSGQAQPGITAAASNITEGPLTESNSDPGTEKSVDTAPHPEMKADEQKAISEKTKTDATKSLSAAEESEKADSKVAAEDDSITEQTPGTGTGSEHANEPPVEAGSTENQQEAIHTLPGNDNSAVKTSPLKDSSDAESKANSPKEEVRVDQLSAEKSTDEPGEEAKAQIAETPDAGAAEPDPARAKFKEISAAFKSKVSAAREAIKRLEEETVATAKDLLTELQSLVENEENIGKAFAGFNAIQEKWKSLPRVSNDNYRDLNVEYNKLIERFFYNINIYKELKELDLKRNLEEKQKVLETQKNLLEVKDIRLLEVEVRMNQDRWNEIGPTFKEEWDKIKDEFWEITRSIYKKIQDFYNLRKEEQERNLEIKKELLEAAKQIEMLELKAHKKWQEKTKEVIELQKKWKLVGFVPKDKAKSVWKEFRETCDSFFEKKREHYAEIRKEQDTNKDAKEALLKEAEELKDSTDWKEASNRLINLQKKWKEIGAAHQRDENKLWKKFRAACDHFFQARNAQKAENTEQEKENFKAKQHLLEKLEAFNPDPSDKGAINELKAFSEEWRKIGHVPFKEKDKVNNAYKQLMDEKFSILKVDKREKEKMRFEEKIDLLKSSDAKDKLVRKEQDFIRSKISKIESEINQYENNLGFFANSKGAEKMKEEVMKKIDKAREDVDALYSQLEVLDEVE